LILISLVLIKLLWESAFLEWSASNYKEYWASCCYR